MGTVTLLLPDPMPPGVDPCLDQACLAGGYDLAPVPTVRRRTGGRLVLSKDANESGYLSMPWPLPGGGTAVVRSATLRERAEPYHLVLELARGELNHARTQAAEWEAIGLTLDPADRDELRDAARLLGTAAVDPAAAGAAAAAGEVLARAHRLADRVGRVFAAQLLHTRLAEGGPLPTGVGCRLSEVPPPDQRAEFLRTFDSARLVPDWRAIEPAESRYDWAGFDALVDWAVGAGLRVSVGPLVDLAHGPFPDWMADAAGDLPSLAAFTCDFVETVVGRYRDRVRDWAVFAGVNHADAHGLGEDDRLRLAAKLLDAARGADPAGAWVIGVAQPWGDYLADDAYTYSPVVFVDTLMRAEFSFAAVDLEVLRGAGPRASPPRDLLELYRMLELFNVLGLPLEVTVGRPPADPEAAAEVGLAAALPQVRAVYWEGWTGGPACRVPEAGWVGTGPGSAAADAFRAVRGGGGS